MAPQERQREEATLKAPALQTSARDRHRLAETATPARCAPRIEPVSQERSRHPLNVKILQDNLERIHPKQTTHKVAVMKFHLLALGIFISFIFSPASAQSALDHCAKQFIGGNKNNAPTIGNSAPTKPYSSNKHLCYRGKNDSFFAIEYWPEQFAPVWAAYRLDPKNYGPKACKTFTRDKANCYARKKTWAEFKSCHKAKDPFHSDHQLSGATLNDEAFVNTGHDRGHVAPRQAFSWNVCATYQTFTMANMSPQRALLNQKIWQFLEGQVLTWAIDVGPLYVVTGVTFKKFPHHRFQIYKNGTFDKAQIYPPGLKYLDAVIQHHKNRKDFAKGHRLRPDRNANPQKMKSVSKGMRMPTGYYKVIYRPPMNGEPAHAIGFLLPHTFENLNEQPGATSKKAFWAFISRIDLIEQVSNTKFPGISKKLKRRWGDPFFRTRQTGRKVRDKSCGVGTPKGVQANTTLKERLAMCTAKLK